MKQDFIRFLPAAWFPTECPSPAILTDSSPGTFSL